MKDTTEIRAFSVFLNKELEGNGGDSLGGIVLDGDVVAGAGAGRLALEAELNTLLLGFLLQDLVPLHTRQEVVTAFRVLKKEI